MYLPLYVLYLRVVDGIIIIKKKKKFQIFRWHYNIIYYVVYSRQKGYTRRVALFMERELNNFYNGVSTVFILFCLEEKKTRRRAILRFVVDARSYTRLRQVRRAVCVLQYRDA